MDNKPQHNVISVRFFKVGKLYHFEADTDLNLIPGDKVVVETARGWQLGEVAQIIGDVATAGEGSWKSIDDFPTPVAIERSTEMKKAPRKTYRDAFFCCGPSLIFRPGPGYFGSLFPLKSF